MKTVMKPEYSLEGDEVAAVIVRKDKGAVLILNSQIPIPNLIVVLKQQIAALQERYDESFLDD